MPPKAQHVDKPYTKELAVITATNIHEHKFIDGVTLTKEDAAKARRAVRSHVAKTSAKTLRENQPASRRRSNERKRRAKIVTWQVQLDLSDVQGNPFESAPRAFPTNSSAVPAAESSIAQLSCVPLLIDNYIENLAVAVPELDGPGQSFLLRKVWFPMVVHHPMIFQVIMLFSASHYAMEHEDVSMATDILFLKQAAISSLRHAINEPRGRFSDEIIATAAKLASYEAIHGTEEAYHTHMKGVARMVRVRGGLTNLGLDGFLGRLLQFIDTNAAFLLQCKVHLDESVLPKRMNQFLPNPTRFIGIS